MDFLKTKKLAMRLEIFLAAILIVVLLLHYFLKFSPGLDKGMLLLAALIATIPVAINAVKAVMNRHITVDLLAAVALVFSIFASEWTSAVFINLMLTSARIFSRYTEMRAERAIESLLKIQPQKARLKCEDKIVTASISDIKASDLVLVGLGERIPVDGEIEEGEAGIDQSSLTGESLPVVKEKGDQVFSSTLVVSGGVTVRVLKVGKDTTFEKLVALVKESQKNKPKISTIADRFASWYIAGVLVAAVIIYVVSKRFDLVLSIMLVVCADDVAIAIPLAFKAATSYAARHGGIIKGDKYLEALSHPDILFLDKTGTITKGEPRVKEVLILDHENEATIYEYARIVSAASSHPQSKAIYKFASKTKDKSSSVEYFREEGGKGTIAVYKGVRIILGRQSFIEDNGIEVSQSEKDIIAKRINEGENVTFLAAGGRVVALFVIADEVRENARETIKQLRELSINKIVMLTGDNEAVAKKIAGEAGILDFYANLLPDNKIEMVKAYQNQGKAVIMVGDGVNDAAALSQANVGVAMGGTGSAAAIESADVVLMRDDFSTLPRFVKLARFVLRVAKENFVIWGVVNVVGVTLVFAGILDPVGAAAYNFITDFIPLINSAKLFNPTFLDRHFKGDTIL